MAPNTHTSPYGLVVAGLLTTSSLATKVKSRDDLPAGYVAASYYPTPHTGWVADWEDSVAKAQALVATMTLAEKANITAGTGIFMGKFSCHQKTFIYFDSQVSRLTLCLPE